MRTRRHFQPLLDSMPTRLAPSSGGGTESAPGCAGRRRHCLAFGASDMSNRDDTDMPQSGSSTPKIPPA